MTIEEAISYLSPIADSASDKMHYGEALEVAISALRDQAERENPQPLTLEELRRMDGEPVFVANGLNSWGTVLVDISGYWSGIPFVQGQYFYYNVEMRELNCYRTKPKGRE